MSSYLPIKRVQLIRETRFAVSTARALRGSADAVDVVQSFFDSQLLAQECFAVVLLDTKNKVLGVVPVTTGTLDCSLVHPREVFTAALLANCSSIVLAHNHPSGEPSPSREDIQVTRRLIEAGRILGIEILDHVISGSYGLSMRESNSDLWNK